MISWLTVLIALWTYPIITFIIVKIAINKSQFKRAVNISTAIITILTLLGLVFNVSTTIKLIDWIALTSTYFSVCLILWYFFFSKMKLIKILSILGMVVVFGIGYISSTFGILGVGFVLGEYDTSVETRISKNLIYKETSLGNAISDYRGKRVEIYKTISWLPIIEWRILDKEYYNVIPYLNRLNVVYLPETKTIYLNAEDIRAGKIETWADTLKLKE
ncbi:MAG: hypothetical protein ACOXZQ_14080 [Bacteroidales bacterium]|jgi:hypothetical protein|nr:MAG: hypothetical protein BWX53_00568 [Parcubacteria group bacterium ADurb.Bin016]